MRPPKVISVVGYKNTGKTTLVSKLVAAFKAEGLRVATCKHDGGHDFTLDTPGTDTYKHRQAGADVTLIASRTHAAMQVYYEQEPPLDDWLAKLSDPALALDLVIVEGWKRSDLPKIVLLGPEKIERMTNVVAFAGDCRFSSIAVEGAEVYDRNDVAALVRLLHARVLD